MVSRIVTAIRRNIPAWLALFVALSGTSIAASHYMITRATQITPSVRKQLRGLRGAVGATGPAGRQGAQGLQGKEGPQGKEGLQGKEGPQGNEGPQGPIGPKGEAGAKGEAGQQGEKGPEGKEGKQGKEGPKGTALAYAHVGEKGELYAADSTENLKVETVTGIQGVYCVSGLSFEPRNAVATADANDNYLPVITVSLGVGTGSKCRQGTQITVETYEVVPVKNPENGKMELNQEKSGQGFYLAIN